MKRKKLVLKMTFLNNYEDLLESSKLCGLHNSKLHPKLYQT